ncbi:uncharacterized membrane protein YoaK (UPF0700 family) [Bradyrhizobium elkanii]|nr:uncharacterized membrane protein YoaK (UPF0700 family) [Bradyrhizobium elkanii]
MAILGFILLVVMFFVMIAVNKAHKDETGVNMPSRNAMRNIRRTARKKGISQQQAYDNWLRRKQRSGGT